MSTFGAPGGRRLILNLSGTFVLKYNGQDGALTQSTQTLLNKLHHDLTEDLASINEHSISLIPKKF